MEHLRSHQQSSLVASEAEILHTIHQHRLMGRGIGYMDAGLITSCLHSGCRLWTLDRVGDEIRIRPAARPITGALHALASFSPTFLAGGRGEQEQQERPSL